MCHNNAGPEAAGSRHTSTGIMKTTKAFLTSLFVCMHLCASTEKIFPKICIVGGGMGGITASFYLKEHFGDQLDIDLYESGDVGGRLATVKINGQEYEAGGSIIHPKNQYMTNFTKLLGLRQRDRHPGGRVGLYDGQELVFTTSENKYITIAKLLWRYGLSVPFLQDFVDHSLADFDRIYKHQEDGHAFTTPSKLISSMSPEFVEELQVSVNDYMSKRDYDQTFIDQFVMSALLTNYGQTTGVHAFVGMVALGGIQPGLWSVHGGNKMVPTELLGKTNANLIQAKVTKISLLPDGKYDVHYEKSGQISSENYDIVILATPLETSGIDLENLSQGSSLSSPRKFHRTVANFVHGQLNASFFGLSSQEDLMKAILSTNPDQFFNSIGFQEPVDLAVEGQPTPDMSQDAVWKVFSKRPLEEEELDRLFTRRDEVKVVDWLAYPNYLSQPRMEALPQFELHKNLYYVNAIEWTASAMETVAIGGRNAALLAIHRWEGNVDKIDSPAVTSEKSTPKKVEL